jgi:hypothetical protein
VTRPTMRFVPVKSRKQRALPMAPTDRRW